MNSSLFQSIYTSILTNVIILKELNEKRKMKIDFRVGTNWIGKERKGQADLKGKRIKRRGEEWRKVIKETLEQ
jgi:hypothetical protein